MTTERSVLIVDDDPDIRESVADALEDEGYRVASASNGSEALRLLRERQLRPDVILLDLMMPVMDGVQFCAEQQLDPELSKIPIVLVSASGSSRALAQQLHAAACMSKPVRLDDLLVTIDRVCLGAA
jgi:CheY-like chemotaxis protein